MNKKKIINIGLFLFFIFLTSFIYFYHENWRDEVQAYLLIRDMDIISFIKNISYEGHPFLYYLILYPFIKLGFNLKIINILSLLFIYISVYLIIFKSDIKLLFKILIIFSYMFLFSYSIIGRSYSLIILLIVLISILYKNKDNNIIYISILIGLLLNTHLLCSSFCFILFIDYFYNEFIKNKNFNKKNIIGFSIIVVFGLLFIIQFIPRLFISNGMSLNNNFGFYSILKCLYSLLMFGDNKLFGIIFIFFNLCFIYYNYRDNKKVFNIYLFSIIIDSIIIAYIWNGYDSHLGLLSYVYYIFILLNISYKSNLFINVLMFLVIFYNYFNVNYLYNLDYHRNYSGSLDASSFIKNNINKDSNIYCFYDANCSSILGYLDDYKFKSVIYGDFSYIVWTKERESLKYSLDNIDVGDYYIYINEKDISCTYDDKIINELKEKFKLMEIYSSDISIIRDETYIIFEIMEKQVILIM